MIEGMVGKIAARLEQQPDDVEGWARLGRSYMVLGEPQKARDAYEHAVKLKPDDAALKEAFPEASLVIGRGDAHMLADAEANLSAPFGMPITSPPADRVVREGDVVEAAGIALEVLDVPGHSPGHVVYLVRGEPCVLFGGDVLFAGGIGRYDFPGSDGELLFDGIRRKLYALPGSTVVYPGHGETTTIDRERRTNPFVRAV